MPRYLSIDWGEKHIGLALGVLENGTTGCVIPIKEIATSKWEVAVAEITRRVKESHIEFLVMGNPLSATGLETAGSLKLKRFKGFLERRLKIPVILQNEYFSTQEATGSHSQAAAIILNQYFESYDNDSSRKN